MSHPQFDSVLASMDVGECAVCEYGSLWRREEGGVRNLDKGKLYPLTYVVIKHRKCRRLSAERVMCSKCFNHQTSFWTFSTT